MKSPRKPKISEAISVVNQSFGGQKPPPLRRQMPKASLTDGFKRFVNPTQIPSQSDSGSESVQIVLECNKECV